MSNEFINIDSANNDKADFQLRYISISKYEGDWHSLPHTHQFSELFYVLRGEGVFYIEDEKPDTRTVVILRDEVKEGFKSKVKDILEKIIDKNVDSLRFYYLGEKYKNKVEHIGAKETIKMDEPLIF